MSRLSDFLLLMVVAFLVGCSSSADIGNVNSNTSEGSDDGAACLTDGDCPDPSFCTISNCVDGKCVDLPRDCGEGRVCNEDLDACVTSGEPCDPETQTCDEDADAYLMPCTDDVDCDDDVFCNGAETCGFNGVCQDGELPCETGVACVELDDRCAGEVVLEIDYFEHAEVAREQLDSGQIPVILREDGELLTLQMPDGQGADNWTPGTIILVEDQQGNPLHKYVVYAAQLADGTVGVIAREATLLSAINSVTAANDTTAPNVKPKPRQKVIASVSSFQHTEYLSDYSIELGDYGTVSWAQARIEFDFNTRAELEINSPVLETVEAGFTWVRGRIAEEVSIVVALLDDGEIDSDDDIRLLRQRLENNEEFQEQVDDILQAMEDPERIKDASVTIDGTLHGVFQPEFVLSASIDGEQTFQILPEDFLIPLPPTPAQISLNASLVLGASISGELALTTGMEFGAALHAEAHWQEGVATASMKDGAYVRSLDIPQTVDRAKGEFTFKVGVQPEVGLELFKIVGFTVKPEVYAELRATGTGGTDCVQLAFGLFGGIDASVRGEALLWETDELTFFKEKWPLGEPERWESPECDEGRLLVADAGADETIDPGGSITLGGSATGGDGIYIYGWSPTTGLDDPRVAKPAANPTTTTTYTLTVTDSSGNMDTDDVTVTVNTDKPNIRILNISENRSTVDPGDIVTITVDTRNDGGGSGIAHVGVTVSEPESGFCNLRWQTHTYGGPGSTKTFTYSYTVPAVVGGYDIISSAWSAELDYPQAGECQPDGLLDGQHPAGARRENGEFQVSGVLNIKILNISENRSTVDPGDIVTITVDTRNDGVGSGTAHVGVTVFKPDGGFCNLRWQTHNYDGPGSTKTFTYSYTVPNVVGDYDIISSAWSTQLSNPQAGECQPVGLLDGQHPAGPHRENGEFQVSGALNIRILSISDNRSTVDAGDIVTITVDTRNDGVGSGTAHVGVTVLEPDDGFCNLCWQTHNYGSPGSTKTFTYTYTVLNVVGDYDIISSAWSTQLGNPQAGECQPDGLLDGQHPAGPRRENGEFQVSGALTTAPTTDDFEPDDTRAQATPLSTGTTPVHSVVPVGDEDWFTFTLTEAADVVIETPGATDQISIRLWEGITLIQGASSGCGGYCARIAEEALPAGTYDLSVFDTSHDEMIDSYAISFSFFPWEGGGDEPDEYEPDDWGDGTTLTPGVAQAHNIRPLGDRDYYVFTLTVVSDVIIETSGPSGDDQMMLNDSDGNRNQLVYADSGGVGSFSRIEKGMLYPGTYTVVVEANQDEVIDSYDILLTVTPSSGSGDAYEPDDQFGRTHSISTDQIQTHSIVPTDDLDWLEFYLRTTSDVVIETSGDLGGDTLLSLYSDDSWPEPMAQDNDGGRLGLFSRLDILELPSGRYYLKVEEYGNDAEIFSYDISFTAVESTTAGDAYEPDDTYDQATYLSPDRPQTHSIVTAGDEDWLTFTLSSVAAVVIESVSDTPLDEIWLYNSDLSEIGHAPWGGLEWSARLEQLSLPSGTYYIKIASGSAHYEIPSYDILLSVD